MTASLSYELINDFKIKPHVQAKFFYSNHLVFLLVKMVFNFFNQVPAGPVTPASDDLNIFRIYAQSFHASRFYMPYYRQPLRLIFQISEIPDNND